jgi:transposase InsO family protein
VNRDFTAGAPNQLWLADLTEHRTAEGKLYLCAIKDVFSNRIVGYSIADRMHSRIVVHAVDSAVALPPRPSTITYAPSNKPVLPRPIDSTQFRARRVARALRRHDMLGSMGKVGSAGDNAAMESFFALLQNNVLNRHAWQTRDELRIAIVTWIERTYQRRRRQAALGRLTPIEYEAIMTPAAHAA